MELKELIEKLQKLYAKHGNIDVFIDISIEETDNYDYKGVAMYVDDTLTIIDDHVTTGKVADIYESNDMKGKITGIAICNY